MSERNFRLISNQKKILMESPLTHSKLNKNKNKQHNTYIKWNIVFKNSMTL